MIIRVIVNGVFILFFSAFAGALASTCIESVNLAQDVNEFCIAALMTFWILMIWRVLGLRDVPVYGVTMAVFFFLFNYGLYGSLAL